MAACMKNETTVTIFNKRKPERKRQAVYKELTHVGCFYR